MTEVKVLFLNFIKFQQTLCIKLIIYLYSYIIKKYYTRLLLLCLLNYNGFCINYYSYFDAYSITRKILYDYINILNKYGNISTDFICFVINLFV